ATRPRSAKMSRSTAAALPLLMPRIAFSRESEFGPEWRGKRSRSWTSASPMDESDARQRRSSFISTIAMLPRRSVTWSKTGCFAAEIGRRFGMTLGRISLVGRRWAYPLEFVHALRYVDDRLALIGDAAHAIHPIAGQGLNLGLRDIAALAEAVVDAARLGLDPGSAAVLDRYQRWRRFDTMAMGVATDGLNRLFSNRSDVLRLVRDVGLGLVERAPVLKRFFIREAAGLVGEVPRLLRGEAL